MRHDNIQERLVHYAEQLGQLAGTVRGHADGMLDRPAVANHLKSIRDGAAELLRELTPSARAAKRTAATPRSRPPVRNPLVASPGKRHRAAPKANHGVKHSDQHVSKLKAATMKGRHSARG
ncbi:MAG TPA: hypothetical protein VHZ73_04175 [Vicinamibacterales bacterium]|jgi:hypothetical protein|nr:hypothetical protein [Vicinamibacterales bacterium]